MVGELVGRHMVGKAVAMERDGTVLADTGMTTVMERDGMGGVSRCGFVAVQYCGVSFADAKDSAMLSCSRRGP